MCYDIETSIFALIINIIASFALFYYSPNKQLKILALFFLFVGVMQFWDAIFWTFDASTSININSTKLAMIWNHLEPIVLGLLIYNYSSLTSLSIFILLLYTISMIIYSVKGWSTLKGTKSKCGGSLYWQWNNMNGSVFVYTLFLLCLIILLQQQFTGWIKWLGIVITLCSFFFSLYKYQTSASTGRFWCYFAAFSPLLFLIGLKLIYENPKQTN